MNETKILDLERKIKTNEEKLGNIKLKILKLRKEEEVLERKLLNQQATLCNLKVKVDKEKDKALEVLAEAVQDN